MRVEDVTAMLPPTEDPAVLDTFVGNFYWSMVCQPRLDRLAQAEAELARRQEARAWFAPDAELPEILGEELWRQALDPRDGRIQNAQAVVEKRRADIEIWSREEAVEVMRRLGEGLKAVLYIG